MSAQDWTPAVHAYLAQAPTSPFQGRSVEPLAHWTGQDHLLWRFRVQDHPDVVVKLFTDAGQVRSRRQFRGQERFAPLGLAPYPVVYDRYPQGLPRQVLLYLWVEAPPLDLADPVQGDALAQALARVHGTEPSTAPGFSPHPVNLAYFWRTWQGSEEAIGRELARRGGAEMADLFRALWSQARTTVAQALPRLGQAPPGVIHGDPAVENVLWQGGQAMLLDWELYGLGDPAQEVARFLHRHGPVLGAPGQEAWLATYLAHGPADPTLADRVRVYRRLLPLYDLTRLLRGVLGTEHPPDRDQATFLAETLAASFHQAGEHLWPPDRPRPDRERLRAQCQALLAGEERFP